MDDNLFDVFKSQDETIKPGPVTSEKEKFDKVAWSEKKQIERGQVFKKIDDTISDVTTNPENFKQYFDVLSRFDKYSLGNELLIVAQKPNATKLADFDHWKENKVAIKKDEKGINILEPGEEYKREDGSLAVSYNVKKVFDISQTTATPKPEPTVVKHDEQTILKALFNKSPAPIIPTDKLRDNVCAFYKHDTHEIFVRRKMDGPDVLRSVAQEIAHAHIASAQGQDTNYSRLENSFNAYVVSYVISKRNGLDTSSYNFSKVSEQFSDLDPRAVREQLLGIRTVANDISMNMSEILNPEQKQYSKNKSEQSR